MKGDKILCTSETYRRFVPPPPPIIFAGVTFHPYPLQNTAINANSVAFYSAFFLRFSTFFQIRPPSPNFLTETKTNIKIYAVTIEKCSVIQDKL